MARLVGATLVAVLVPACTGGAEEGTGPPAGGTLRIRALADPFAAGDPAVETSRAGWELYRCCLLRTLMSYTGTPTARGGTTLHPDLADGLPRVSGDGMTWTFHLRRGLRYGPPLEDTPVVAQDVVRALQRAARSGTTYGIVFSVIEGFDEFAAGRTPGIVGLAVRDPRTLVVRLTEPTGDLGYRLSLPAAAPVPAPAVRGHQGAYDRFLVATGPYMIAGSERLDLSGRPARQRPVAGYEPGKAIFGDHVWEFLMDQMRVTQQAGKRFIGITYSPARDR